MKKNYLVALLILVINFVNAQIEQTTYRGAFAPAPTAMWTDSWTNWDPQNEPYTDAATVVNVTTDITTSTTWTTGKTYKLNGLIYVRNNATLTIQPGVIIKGNYTNTGTALIITKGAKINAVGTSTSPIVFTSAKAAGSRQPGDWGGIVLLGKAAFNINNGVNNIEGITATVNTEYGGGATPDDNDNSGTLKYVRIEYGGFVFSPNNEINGLTFGAVGKGTTIDYVQVSFTGDDSFEWFGGSVNCKHLVSYRGLDDDFDTDNGYKGVVQFALGVRDPNLADNPAVSTSEGFESDNNASGSVSPSGIDNTSAIFTNVTLIGPSKRATLSPSISVASGYARALRLRRATQLKVYNSLFLDFKQNFLFVDGSAAVTNANDNKLKFQNNLFAGVSSSDLSTYPNGVNPTSLNTWMSTNNNASQSLSAGVLTKPYDDTSSVVYTGLDYRPGTGSPALSGASFSDISMKDFLNTVEGTTPVVSNVTYCKGTVAAKLSATLTTTGVSLKWYTAATGGVAATVAPTPLTTVVGAKDYYVSQVDALGNESARVKLTVTTVATPTEVLGTITGVNPDGLTGLSATAVGKFVGTTSEFTYSIPAFVDANLTYFWTVPAGVNIVSGQGTRNLVVNYANVAAGVGTIGSITCQAKNAGGCATLAKSLSITKALPLAPTTVKLTLGTSTTAITNYGKYMGSTTPLTLTAAVSAAANNYVWELPAGVNLANNGVAGTPYVRYFTAQPFNAYTTNVPSVSLGNLYWKVSYQPYTYDVNGVSTTVTVSTATQYVKLSGAYGSDTSQAYAPYGTVIESNKNAILVDFSGVTNPLTRVLYIGAKAKNGVGVSVTSNATNADVVANATSIPGLFNTTYSEVYTALVPPSTPATSVITASGFAAKTSKLLKLTATVPAAITALAGQITALCTQSDVTYDYTITPSALASSYIITAPVGSIVTSANNAANDSNVLATSDLTFTVFYPTNFSTLPSKTITITSVNGAGNSATNKVVTVSNAVAAIGVATGSAGITNFTRCATQTFTIPAVVAAVEYVWTPANGAVIVSGQGTRTVEVDFSAVANTVTSTILKVVAKNECGTSSVVKSIILKPAACAPAFRAVVSATEVYPNPASSEFNIDITGANGDSVSVSVYAYDGSVAVNPFTVQLVEGTNTINQNIASLRDGIYFVRIVNNSNNEVLVKKLIKG